MTEKILPLPVKKNKFGVRVADLSTTEYYRQIEEEVLEAYKEAVFSDYGAYKEIDDDFWVDIEYGIRREAEELVDIIATCVTRLDILGYDEARREKLYAACNEKNAKRGYFDK